MVAQRTKSQRDAETVVAIDLLEMMDVEGVIFIQGDIESEQA